MPAGVGSRGLWGAPSQPQEPGAATAICGRAGQERGRDTAARDSVSGGRTSPAAGGEAVQPDVPPAVGRLACFPQAASCAQKLHCERKRRKNDRNPQRVRVTQEDEFAQNATVFTGAG